MGLSCSKEPEVIVVEPPQPKKKKKKKKKKSEYLDPFMHDVMQRSLLFTRGDRPVAATPTMPAGQQHLLYRATPKSSSSTSNSKYQTMPTRLVVRRRTVRGNEEGMSGTHIYAVRLPPEEPLKPAAVEQYPLSESAVVPMRSPMLDAPSMSSSTSSPSPPALKEMLSDASGSVDHLFTRTAMLLPPQQKVEDWVTISAEHQIFCADVGLTPEDCDHLVATTETVCRGSYAAYTYAKQTLGCREFPVLARACQGPVHTVVSAIAEYSSNDRLLLDDREPHMVKYDVTRKERQKLDMHTDKSEWTFLISLSTGSGIDFDGGGTFFECLDATVHIQRGHALIFPGRLRHCGQRITTGLRFLLVGFLVDKTASGKSADEDGSVPNAATMNVP